MLTVAEHLTYNPPSLGVSPEFALQIAQSRPTPIFRLFAPEGRLEQWKKTSSSPPMDTRS
jgi:hypothetical protein